MLRSVLSPALKSKCLTTSSLFKSTQRSFADLREFDQHLNVARQQLEIDPKVTNLRELLERKEKDAELRSALNYLEKNREFFLGRHFVTDKEGTQLKEPVRVAVTGAAGAIGYSMIFRIASGEMLGLDQPVHLNLLELPGAQNALQGVVMELKDCAFPLLRGITATANPEEAFDGVAYALLVGAQPRTKGMERADLMKANAQIFSVQGKALNKSAKAKDLKVVVVGNPANTNAYIAANNAPDLAPESFSAMTRLDHNRGLAQLSKKLHVSVQQIKRFAIWGNHSSTQYPDLSHTQVNEKWAKNSLSDDWIVKDFIPTVQQRGAAIINARGSSSAASAASSAIDHIRDWELGTNGEWTSMAVVSDGSYGVTKGLYFSYPVVCKDQQYAIVKNVPIDEFSAQRIEASHKELLSERDAVKDFLPH